jgi:hypothetical protein
MENVDDDSITAATVDVPSDAPTGSPLVRVRLSWDGFDAAGDTDEYVQELPGWPHPAVSPTFLRRPPDRSV